MIQKHGLIVQLKYFSLTALVLEPCQHSDRTTNFITTALGKKIRNICFDQHQELIIQVGQEEKTPISDFLITEARGQKSESKAKTNRTIVDVSDRFRPEMKNCSQIPRLFVKAGLPK